MTRNGWMGVGLATLVALGCDGGTTPPTDAGGVGTDAGRVDAGTDSGTPPIDSGPPPDGGPPPDDGGGSADECGAGPLVLEAIDPGTSITVFNPTAAAVSIDGSGYVLCQRPAYPTLETLQPGVTIPAGGRHVFPWPATFGSTDAGGEVALYTSGAFADPDALVDFVCWGTGHLQTRRDVAVAGDDWSGGCAGAITGDALRRVPGTTGADAASYDPTGAAAELACP
jgi:hypothetical protein